MPGYVRRMSVRALRARFSVGACAVAAAVSLLVAGPLQVAAELEGDRFRSDVWRVSLTTPRNWQSSEQSSYPNLLLRMIRSSPRGQMLLSAERLPVTADA